MVKILDAILHHFSFWAFGHAFEHPDPYFWTISSQNAAKSCKIGGFLTICDDGTVTKGWKSSKSWSFFGFEDGRGIKETKSRRLFWPFRRVRIWKTSTILTVRAASENAKIWRFGWFDNGDIGRYLGHWAIAKMAKNRRFGGYGDRQNLDFLATSVALQLAKYRRFGRFEKQQKRQIFCYLDSGKNWKNGIIWRIGQLEKCPRLCVLGIRLRRQLRWFWACGELDTGRFLAVLGALERLKKSGIWVLGRLQNRQNLAGLAASRSW